MNTSEDIMQCFSALSGAEQTQLLDELLKDHEMRGQVLEDARQELKKGGARKPCPYCKGDKVYKRGRQKGVQMYQCRACAKWYSETTGTPLWDIKLKSKWQGYLRCMEQGKSIKKIAKELGISIQTSFDWRHKILGALSGLAPQTLSNVVECDEMELALSNKGSRNLQRDPRKRASDHKRNGLGQEITVVQVVTAVQRDGDTYLRAVESKRLDTNEITAALDGKLTPDTTLITDGHPSYKQFAKENRTIKHRHVIAKEHVNKKDRNIHLQHVNNTHSGLRAFLLPFKGVSSKYLQNYLNWFAYAHKLSGTRSTIKQWLLAILSSPEAYDLFWAFKKNAVNIRI